MNEVTAAFVDRKRELLFALAQKRQSTRWPEYNCIGDYFNGAYECDFVSPYSKTAGNVMAEVFVLLQDWTSDESIRQGLDRDALQYGRTLWLPTNRKLDELLKSHFGLDMSEVYATNLFPFVKMGGISATIPMRDLVRAAREFALPQIEVVEPRLVICLGLNTFNALRIACGYEQKRPLQLAIQAPYSFRKSRIWCQAHTGARSQNTRGREQVEQDWLRMEADFRGKVE